MATGQYIGVNGVARKVVSPYVGVEGVARNVKNGYVGVDGVARLFFAPESGNVVLEVEKITADTYANDTQYTAEEFILLEIYPKPGGTVNVTYGGLTKTITDTSGAEEPNAQQVFFGTFNGVSDSVETPSSGELIIDGQYRCFAMGLYTYNKKGYVDNCNCITAVNDLGQSECIPGSAFGAAIGSVCTKITEVTIPSSVTSIGAYAFQGCTGLTSAIIGDGVTTIGNSAFAGCTGLTSIEIPASVTRLGSNPWTNCSNNKNITVASNNAAYKIDSGCLIETATNRLVCGHSDAVIPSYVTTMDNGAFSQCTGLTRVTIPSGVTSIGAYAFQGCTGLTSAIIGDGVTTIGNSAFARCTGLTSVTFANTSGWYVTETEDGDASTGTEVNVSDPTNNATLLNSTYIGHYWYRV